MFFGSIVDLFRRKVFHRFWFWHSEISDELDQKKGGNVERLQLFPNVTTTTRS